MRSKVLFIIANIIFAVPVFSQISSTGAGNWIVTFNFGANSTARTFQFNANNDGTGAFRFRAPSVAVRSIFPAVWARPTANTLSFTSEVQLPLTSTVREVGTLVFKGTRATNGTMSGAVIFIIDNTGGLPATTVPYSIRTGTFTAVPLSVTAGRAELRVRR